jgi:flavin reductase (DIM6/NTAB) family NADH-FMN oxidoreductase RutF
MTGVAAGADLRHRAAGRMTTGVSVLTVVHDGRAHGATVSSTSQVSRQPVMISAGLRTGSVVAELACASGWFAVNVLTQRQGLLADWFANPDRPAGLGQFGLVGWDPDPVTGIPLLRNVLAVLTCRVANRVPVGDHELLIAEVVAAEVGVGAPLVNFGGGLHGAEFQPVPRKKGWRSRSTTTAVAVE